MNNMSSTRRKIGRVVAIAALSFGATIGALAASGPAHADGVWTVAAADWNCASQTVSVLPASNEQLDGNFTVWSYAQVYDFVRGSWITEPNWSITDGITSHEFYGVTNPYSYALVTYAQAQNGVWKYWSEWVSITDDLDNLFCHLGY